MARGRDLSTAQQETLRRRLQHAATLLRQGSTVAEAAAAAETSGRRFRVLFARRYGLAPIDYRLKHHKSGSKVVPFRVRTTKELRALRSAARNQGCSVSTFVYRLVRRHLRTTNFSTAR